MKRLQAFKFELQPNGEQARSMRRFAGSCRFVYNKALALQKTNYEAGGKFLNHCGVNFRQKKPANPKGLTGVNIKNIS